VRLRELYVEQQKTIHEVAEHFDISTATVHYWMEKHEIERRYSGTLEERFEQYHEKNANERGCWLWQNEPDEWGYGKIWDAKDERHRMAHRVSFEIHRDEKLPEFSPEHQINHTCHNKRCVNPEHLYIGTAKENSQDALKVEAWGDNRPRGSGVGTSKLNEEQVIEIKNRCLDGESQKSVAEDYPVSHTAVNKIMVGEWWQHVGPDVTEERPGESDRYGEAHGSSKLTADDVREIRELREQGETIADIAKRMPVGTTSVRNVLSGKTWSHVD
jgi:transposase-like protein